MAILVASGQPEPSDHPGRLWATNTKSDVAWVLSPKPGPSWYQRIPKPGTTRLCGSPDQCQGRRGALLEQSQDPTMRTVRTGLRLRFHARTAPEIRPWAHEMATWAREVRRFPVRLPIYFHATRAVGKARDADSTFFQPISPFHEPYIQIATGDLTEFEAPEEELWLRMLHELCRYWDWLEGVETPDEELEAESAGALADFLADREPTGE